MSILTKVVAGLSATALAACAHSGAPLAGSSPSASANVNASPGANAVVMNPTGERLGTATFSQDAGGSVHIHMKLTGLMPGVHGVHIHAVGTCTAPAFASAGGHFNPQSKHHGLNNAAGPHAGDLPNMTVDASGNADYEAATSRVSLSAGPNSLFDADGSAIVVHATADDNMTDPAGNAGARIACGEIKSGAA